MTQFFAPFPVIDYSFGSNEPPVLFQNLATYVNLIDVLKDDLTFYEIITIGENERPDTLSFRLYGTVNYYWTFLLLNDQLRISGWPMPAIELLPRAAKVYPHRVVTTTDNITSEYLPGDIVSGARSGATGIVVKRYLDMGQIVIATSAEFNIGERLISAANPLSGAHVVAECEQYNAPINWCSTSGEFVDIDPYDPDRSNLIPMTYLDQMTKANEQLTQIRAFRRSVVGQVASNFTQILSE